MINAGTQFKPNTVTGALAYAPHELVYDDKLVDSTQAAALQNGQPVVLTATGTVKAAAAGDTIYGIVPFDPISNSYAANERISVATGDVYYFKAGAAIAAGAQVTPDFANIGNVLTAAVGEAAVSVLGTAVTQAAEAGQFIKVEIKPSVLPAEEE
jgi:hypothetical protein